MPSRPRLAIGAGDDFTFTDFTSRELAEAALLGLPLDPDWVDQFMRLIFEKDYDCAREVLRRAVSHGVNRGLAEEYAKVLEDFLRKRDEMDNPVSLGRFGACLVRDEGERGRGLAVVSFTSWGDVLWNERPLAYIQSPCSRKCVQTCLACLAPVGSLASQLAYMGVVAPPGTEAVVLGCRGDQEEGRAPVAAAEGPSPVPCTGQGCPEVFCSQACRDWALAESSHAVLCAGRLPGGSIDALRRLECLAADSDTEHLLLLAHTIAPMVLHLQRGEHIEEVVQKYARQFASRPWEDLAAEGNGANSEDTPELRRSLLAQAVPLLREIFEPIDAAIVGPLLEPELLSGLLGTYELVNMCISLPHPLNEDGKKVAELLAGTGALPRIAALQQAAEGDSESEDEEGGEVEEDAADEGGEPGEEEAAASARAGTLFAHVIGTALCEVLAYTNHSCLPNCNIDFATCGEARSGGPGLWVHGVARRPLMPGDEVLMSYVPSVIGKPLAVRQRRMQKFGFTCHCRTCVTEEMLAADEASMPAEALASARAVAAAALRAPGPG